MSKKRDGNSARNKSTLTPQCGKSTFEIKEQEYGMLIDVYASRS